MPSDRMTSTMKSLPGGVPARAPDLRCGLSSAGFPCSAAWLGTGGASRPVDCCACACGVPRLADAAAATAPPTAAPRRNPRRLIPGVRRPSRAIRLAMAPIPAGGADYTAGSPLSCTRSMLNGYGSRGDRAFRNPIECPGHADGNAKDVAPRARRECSPVIERTDAGGDQPIEQILLGVFRRALIAGPRLTQAFHSGVLNALDTTLTVRFGMDSDGFRTSPAVPSRVLLIHTTIRGPRDAGRLLTAPQGS